VFSNVPATAALIVNDHFDVHDLWEDQAVFAIAIMEIMKLVVFQKV